MNALVHPAVAHDIIQRQAALKADDPIHATLFVETAIYFESGFSHLIQADSVWCIAAPLELRIARVLVRDHTTRAAIQARIDSQMSQEQKMALSDAVLWNDNEHSIIEQLNHLLGKR
jgi:dephospho-CoA kinase